MHSKENVFSQFLRKAISMQTTGERLGNKQVSEQAISRASKQKIKRLDSRGFPRIRFSTNTGLLQAFQSMRACCKQGVQYEITLTIKSNIEKNDNFALSHALTALINQIGHGFKLQGIPSFDTKRTFAIAKKNLEKP